MFQRRARITTEPRALPNAFCYALCVVSLASACKGQGRPLVAQPAVGNGVRIDLVGVDYDHEDLDLAFRVYNQLGYDVVVDRNAMAFVLPTGQELRRNEGDAYRVIPAGGDKEIDVHFQSDTYDFRDGPGFWMRFDGVYMGDTRIAVPAMALASPAHQAGTPQEHPVPDRAREAYAHSGGSGGGDSDGGLFGAVRGVVQSVTGGGSSRSESAPSKPEQSSGLEEYRGPRQKIQLEAKVAAMPLKSSQVPEQVAFIMDELLLTELQTVGFEAIGPDDINAMIGFEGMKDSAGCDDASCAAEIGNALGVPYLTAGNVANLDGTTVITLKLIDVQHTTVLARVSKLADGGTKALPRVIAEAVQEMVKRSGL